MPTGPTRPGLRSRSGCLQPATAIPLRCPASPGSWDRRCCSPRGEDGSPAGRGPERRGGRPEGAGLPAARGHRHRGRPRVPGGRHRRLRAGEDRARGREPADFDAFWAAGKEALAKLPIDARLTPKPELSTAKVDGYHVSLQNVGRDSHGHEPLLRHPRGPKGDGPFPALLQLPGRGRAALPRPRRAGGEGLHHASGRHPRHPGGPDPQVYDSLCGPVALGRATRPSTSTSASATTTAACTSAACAPNDFLVSPPKWDGKNLVVTGGSQGGALTITTAGLDPRVTAARALLPGALGRDRLPERPRRRLAAHLQGGEGRHRTPAKIRTAAYYDVVNFARRREGAGPLLVGLERRDLPADLDVRGLR